MKLLRPLILIPLVALLAVACTPPVPVTSTVESVDVERYLGTWYEVGSVKQWFSAGLVNSKAEYALLPNGAISVVNTGNYFFDGGPVAQVVGTALPVDDTNARLSVSFTDSNSANPPGNYWVVDLDPDYQWSIVSDPTGLSGFILARTKDMSPELYNELVGRAAAKGVDVANLTPTRQF